MSRDGPSKLYQRGRFAFGPRLGGDKEGFRKGPGGRPLPPLLRSRPGSGRETGKEKGKEAAAPADPPALLCPESPPMQQVRGFGSSLPRNGGEVLCPGGVPAGSGDGRDQLQEQGLGSSRGKGGHGRALPLESPPDLCQGKGLLPALQQCPP